MLKLDRIVVDQLHMTFLEAFADYAMDASSVSEESMRLRSVKNGVDDELSVGAFEGDRMVGFTLIGVGPWEGKLAAFDAGTGIIPVHRGSGLAKRMFDHALPGLRKRGVSLFLLEVLQGNEAAIRAYEKAGFAITREFTCLRLPRDDFPEPLPSREGISIRPSTRHAVLALADQADWTPSWENSFTAIERIPEQLLILGAFSGEDCVGAVVYSPGFHWILSLLVDRAHRRLGIATALLRGLCAALPAETEELKITNVFSGDRGMIDCLKGNGFAPWVDQYEMALAL
jgi:ribosomal protein S18 acetylase RimI-like enzyme